MKNHFQKNLLVLLLIYFTGFHLIAQEQQQYKIFTVGFYNVENLFDTINNADTFDDDRTVAGKDHWDTKKYYKKLDRISQVIAELGHPENPNPPAIIGLCEVENKAVLEDLLKTERLDRTKYGIVHYDSPDERGVDVALLFDKQVFQVTNSQARKLIIYEADEPSKRDYTRDQLVVSGYLGDEEIAIIVNHWPSRGGGEQKSKYKREKAALLNKKIIDSLYTINPAIKILSMGDLNDDPTNSSLKKILKTKANRNELQEQELFNPMENMFRSGKGTLAYRDSWNLFDQIIMNTKLANANSGLQFYKAKIFNEAYLINQNGQYRGYPWRTYSSSGYDGGYSDHFPVFIYLITAVK